MRLFISYAHDDMPLTKQFVKLLEAHEVWFDQNLRGGEEWWHRILDRIDWCQGLVYLLSPASVESEYCRREAEIALSSNKIVIPVIIHRRAQPPSFLDHIQYIDLSKGLETVESVLLLMNTLFFAEREARNKDTTFTQSSTSHITTIPPSIERSHDTHSIRQLPYNYIYRLEQKGLSESTKNVYKRLICDFLERIAGVPEIPRQERESFLSHLSIDVLEQSLTVAQVNAWLGMLKADGTSKLGGAKSAILNLVESLVEDNILDQSLIEKIKAIKAYKLDFEKRPRRILTYQEVLTLMASLGSDTKLSVRNAAVVSLLMVLRSGEVSNLRWKDVSIHGNKITVRSPVNPSTVQLPNSVHDYFVKWRDALVELENGASFEDTFVIRRFQHGDNIKIMGVSKTSLHEVLSEIAQNAGIGRLSPEDLRISVRRLMEQKGREHF